MSLVGKDPPIFLNKFSEKFNEKSNFPKLCNLLVKIYFPKYKLSQS